MNDTNPTPDQTPESTPDAATVPVTPTPEAATPAAAPTVAPAAEKPGRNRALLIGGGIAAAVILVGGGVAVGAAIVDEFGDDDRAPIADGPRYSDNDGADDRNDRDRRDRDRDDARNDNAPANGRGPATDIGTASADELVEIADAARSAADGEVTSIDAKREGVWEVQLTNAAGDETELRVDASLAASVISTEAADGDDTGPVLTLDDDTIRALVAAALAEADGLITDLDVDSDPVSPYDVSVLTADNRSVDIDFDADFAVIATDIDD